MDLLQPVKGTRDLLFFESKLFSHISELVKDTARIYGYNEVHLPIFEYASVFERTLGEGSDIVHKQMYTFTDKGGRSLTLRPEFTASIARSIISNNLYEKLPLRLFSVGPVFRYENPQKGRYRQFNQINFECVGFRSPAMDAEIIAFGKLILDKLGVKNTTLELNSLGDLASRRAYTQVFYSYLTKYESELSEDSQIRLKKNPLRILDSKVQSDQKILEGAPILSNYLTKESKSFFEELIKNLNMLGIKYSINNKIVRGLDYYTDTVFEFTTTELGAQSAILAGGRYDGLFKIMGGKDIAAVGMGIGVDRLMALCERAYTPPVSGPILVFIGHEQYSAYGLEIVQSLHNSNMSAVLEISKDVGKSIKRAIENNAKFVIFIGENETACRGIRLKNLETRAEQKLPLTELINFLKKYEL